MSTRIASTILFSAGVVLAASGLTAPTVGFSLDAAGDVRPLLGVRGNLLVEPPILRGAKSAAFWNNHGVAKTETAVLTLDPAGRVVVETPAPSGPAVVGLSPEGPSSIVWFSESRLLWAQRGNAFYPLPTAFEGDVVAAADGRTGTLLVRRVGAIWRIDISKRTGRVQAELPLERVHEPLLLLPDLRLLYTEDGALVVRNSAGTESRIPLSVPVTSMQLSGTDVIRLQSTTASLLLRLDGISGSLEFLPEGN